MGNSNFEKRFPKPSYHPDDISLDFWKEKKEGWLAAEKAYAEKMAEAKKLLEENLEKSATLDESCFDTMSKPAKVQYLALQLTISQALALFQEQPEDINEQEIKANE